MEKIKIITDSACDIPAEFEKAHNELHIMPIPLTIDGKGYYERRDFDPWKFYELLHAAKQIPVTSHITNIQFAETYLQAAQDGYTSIIVITITSRGSNMFQAANMGRDMFYEDNPEYKDKVNIHVLDSGTYTVGYGYAIEKSIEMIQEGKTTEQIIPWLEEYFARVEIYFAVFSLEYVKKSGRVSAAAGFVGDVLGVRPIISIIDGETKIVEKVRGDKNVPGKLADWYQKRSTDPKFQYCTVTGEAVEFVKPFHQAMEQRVGYPPYRSYQVGASIAINSGPRVLAFIVLGEDRRNKR